MILNAHSGNIDDSCCDFQTLETVNTKLAPLLGELVSTTFFRYYKVDLNKECPFWQENPSCVMKDCSVIEADESEIPEDWKMTSLSAVDRSSKALHDQGFSLMSKSCSWTNKDFCQIEDDSAGGAYIHLLRNPERFTGYAGPSTKRIWDAIYKENCFDGKDYRDLEPEQPGAFKVATVERDEQCMEKRVFYRMISGLHASISTHICWEYMDRRTGVWGKNLTCFVERVGNHKERVQNLYFTYGLLLRAVKKLAPYLQDHTLHPFCTGNSQDTDRIERLVNDITAAVGSCAPTFDEKALFASSPELLDQFKNHFRNISRIMDCVACEKCRLWGKIQVTGLGTALKVLFSFEDDPKEWTLTRGEVVALFNALTRLSESISAVDEFRSMYRTFGGSAASKSSKLVEPSDRPSDNSKDAPKPKQDPQKNVKVKSSSPDSKPSGKPKPVSAPAPSAPEEPLTQLPPLPLADMLSFTQLNDPRYYVPYTIGIIICVLGVARIVQKATQMARGTMALPRGHVRAPDGKVVELRPDEGDSDEVVGRATVETKTVTKGKGTPNSAQKRRTKRAA
ncbi:hypothetical protein HDV00_009144 [Rhizophlyctis rosea]|nr:hypothetical protein HDV00_009144 [Rhizophlyctis rosea]